MTIMKVIPVYLKMIENKNCRTLTGKIRNTHHFWLHLSSATYEIFDVTKQCAVTILFGYFLTLAAALWPHRLQVRRWMGLYSVFHGADLDGAALHVGRPSHPAVWILHADLGHHTGPIRRPQGKNYYCERQRIEKRLLMFGNRSRENNYCQH